ncbi:MAG: helix-turn-helix transcriptional regulator [Lachnospiraceae bacterium]|nr:helix-turn-helix transcriptional regulator [Lachnospiraceae bacterium]
MVRTDSFGTRLLEYRKQHFLTQQKMAELLGVSPNHVGVLERGIKQPRASTEAAFARLSGEWISGWNDWEISLNDDEEEYYTLLWARLCGMDEEQRDEVMEVFLRILHLVEG